MTLYFAYGSNMHSGDMHRRCPHANALGVAHVAHARFVIMREGYASIVQAPGAVVWGVVWRLTPRDIAALHAYEAIDSGLYHRHHIAVVFQSRRRRAMVYLARPSVEGVPRPGYMASILIAARDWDFPIGYQKELARWQRSRSVSAGV